MFHYDNTDSGDQTDNDTNTPMDNTTDSGTQTSNTSNTPSYHATVYRDGSPVTALPVNTGSGCATTQLGNFAENLYEYEGATSIKMPSIPGVNAYTSGIPAALLSGTEESGTLVFSTCKGSISLSGNMLSKIEEIPENTVSFLY